MNRVYNLPQVEPSPTTGAHVTALFLALYLLVLAFFIILVTISTPEDVKSQAVMDSLSSTFSSLLPPSTDLTSFSSREGDMLAGQAFQEEMTDIFATAVQVAKIEIVQPGRLMRVRIPSDTLFFPDSTDIREAQIPLLDRVVASISGATAGLRHDLEFIIGSPYVGDNSLPIGETLETARVGAFARAMQARGVPPQNVSVGLRPGDPDEIVVRFFVRTEDEARLKLKQAVETESPVRTLESGAAETPAAPEPDVPLVPIAPAEQGLPVGQIGGGG
jgi:hypothetical protein